jgi:SAM-dependent methyltransferase
MQERHSNRFRYFTELADTSRDFYVDYICDFFPLNNRCSVLEVGCGEGGNLLPFAEMGCCVTGVDRSEQKIIQAHSFYQSLNRKARFVVADFFEMPCPDENEKYDIVLVHDVIEHIAQKEAFLVHLKRFTAKNGVVFWRFPAWQMPFGGHQQICQSAFCSKLPFVHLLPLSIYRRVLRAFGEQQATIDELIDIKKCRVSIELFERLLSLHHYVRIDRCLWLINPHYKQKFQLKPRKLSPLISKIRYFRNFLATSCFYLTKCEDDRHRS